MEITPAEVQSKQFDQVKRGFDPQQVGAFLDTIAGVLARRDEMLIAANAEIERLRKLDSPVPAEAQEAFRLALDAAAQAKADLLQTAAAEAERIQSEARAAAEIIVKQAAALLEGGVSGPLAETAEAAISAMNDTIEAAESSAPAPETDQIEPRDVTQPHAEPATIDANTVTDEVAADAEVAGADADDHVPVHTDEETPPQTESTPPARNWLTPGPQRSAGSLNAQDARIEGAAPAVSRPPLELVIEETPEAQPDDSESSLASRVGDLRG